MALILKDRVKETSTTSGTGTLTLAGAVTGYQSFSSAIGNGNTTYYAIYQDGGSDWEVGIGTVGSGTLSRTTVLASSNGGSLVNFSGAQLTVWCDYPAGKAAYLDASGVLNNTVFNATTNVISPNFDAANSAGGALRNASGTNQLQWGAGGGNNITFDVATNINPANSQVDISPTGTGLVKINPATTGSIDNMVIGATTPKAITGTTITATTFNGSGSGLTNVVNSLTASTGINVSGSTGAVTVTNTAPDQTVTLTAGTGISTSGTYPNFTITNTSPSSGGTVTNVSGTSPIAVANGTTTPTVSIQVANSTQSGYLTSTDWNTFNNKQPAGTYVTSVGATAPITSTGGTTPTIAIPVASASANGYLSSTDWSTFNSKAPATSGTSILYGNGSGGFSNVTIGSNLTFSGGTLSASGATPAGSNTQVQYNNSGAFGASSSFTFNSTTGDVTAPQQVASNGLIVNSATVSNNYTIASGNNAMSVGPITVASGKSVTISSGQRWVVL